ncbi:MAG: ABC transporter permease [Candidatus Nanopelagicales bacterium]|nr:ABC transporter permease [Candidatus Nanopelagicales bacterium]
MAKNLSSSETEIRIIRPFRAGVPNLRQYFIDIRNRKEFVLELSRAERAEEHLDTVFGQLWSVASPLLSSVVFYLFIFVVQGGHQGTEYFLHLLAGIFIFELVTTAGNRGATSIVRAGALLNNTSFPRVILPLSDILTAFRVFLPAMFIYVVFHLTMGGTIYLASLQALLALTLLVMFASGLAMFASTAQVYFRDTQALMPFILRLTMFISPVLYFPEQAKALFDGRLLTIFNPLFCMIQIFSGSIVRGDTFDGWTWFMAIFWATVSLIGGFWFLVSREGEFAARI